MTERAHLLWVAVAVMLMIAVGILLGLVRQRRLRGKYGLFWLAVVGTVLPLAVFPALVDRLGDSLGVRYQPVLLLFAAITVLTFLSMHFSWEVSRLEERSRSLAEELALLRERVDSSLTGESARSPDGEDGCGSAAEDR